MIYIHALRNDELMYATNMEPIIHHVLRKKIKGIIMLYNNPVTKHIIFKVGEMFNYYNMRGEIPPVLKKSSVVESLTITASETFDQNNHFTNLKMYITTLDEEKMLMQESENVREIKKLLNNPSIENWRKINDLLIPTEIAHLQSKYWGNVFNPNVDNPEPTYYEDLEIYNIGTIDNTTDSIDNTSLNDSSFDAG